MIELKTPIEEQNIRRLKVGDLIYITGTLVTARDLAHKKMVQYLQKDSKLPFVVNGSPLFHCGPLVKKVGFAWSVLAAGPTTSMRMEPYEHYIIEKLGVRFIIGKGGMGRKTSEAMEKFGSAYGVFTGGAAVLAAERVTKVISVEWLDLGIPDAVWTFQVKRFGPLIVGMDPYGNNLFNDVKLQAKKKINGIVANLQT